MIYFGGLLLPLASFALTGDSGRIEARGGRPKPKLPKLEIACFLKTVAIWSRLSRARCGKEARDQEYLVSGNLREIS